jgi:hypothetical protein
MATNAYLNTLKALYIVAPHCDGCGLVPLFRHHECNHNEIKEHCPGCGKLLSHYRAGELLFRAERCKCETDIAEGGGCPFCLECCKLLDAPVRAQVS